VSDEQFLRTRGLNIVLNNPHSLNEEVSALTGDELTHLSIYQSDLYNIHSAHPWKTSPDKLKWFDITTSELKKSSGLTILMEQVKHIESRVVNWPHNTHTNFPQDYEWKPFCGHLASLALSDNSQHTQDSDSLFKIQPFYEYFVHKFRLIYSLQSRTSLNKGMILWQGGSKSRTYNPRKITE
jgi:hypothetical protein